MTTPRGEGESRRNFFALKKVAGADEHLAELNDEIEKLRGALSELRGGIFVQKPNNLQTRYQVFDAAIARLNSARSIIRLLQSDMHNARENFDRAHREAWEQKGRRAEASAKVKERDELLQQIRTSTAWKIVKPFWKLLRRSQRRRSAPTEISNDFVFGFDLPNEWKTNREILFVKGWCFSKSGRGIAGIRGKIGRQGKFARFGLLRPDIADQFPDEPTAKHSGFTAELKIPRGISKLRFDAIVQGSDWETFFECDVASDAEGAENDDGLFERDDDFLRPDKPQRCPGISAQKAADALVPLFRSHARKISGSPVFSIVTPIFETKPEWFAEAAFSILNQRFNNWEWCLVDDGSKNRETKRLLEALAGVSPRLQIKSLANAGISAATNHALDLTNGEFVCFLDHDDLLDPRALEILAAKLAEGFDAVYSDQDKLEENTGELVEPFFKPHWSPEYFRGVMYVGHVLCVRRELAQRVRFDSQFDGVQDFEFMLRVSESGAKIGHVPRILYHWRKTPGSIAEKSDAKPEIDALQSRAVNAHLARLGLAAHAENSSLPHRLRIRPNERTSFPKISIIIPTKDAPDLLGRCLESIREQTDYPDFEIVLIDNETTDATAITLMRDSGARRISFPGRFNFSRANNLGAQNSAGEFLVFLNNDTEITNSDWLQHLLYYCEQPDVGAAGALLVYPDRTVQHAGVALGMRGTADHLMRGFSENADGYAGSLGCAREVSAVTAACMMIRKSLFEEIGGFNEHFFTAYQDVDLCLRLRARNFRVIWTPRAVVIHHEWASRKDYYDMVDRMLFLDRWESVIEGGDPYYNKNLNLERGDYSARFADAK